MELEASAAIDLMNPQSLGSLWVPLTLYGLILLAAIYFAKIKIK